ncbi:MAG: hypothetical protein KatS3mg050_2403 [Litorilinea sp.]|nr:MAG: hypothetical protein KatS3mg050_2403 [Litorilinea sp.]
MASGYTTPKHQDQVQPWSSSHGLTGSYAEFLHLVPKLAGQAHVYLLDLRGHGLSAWTDNGYLVADYSHDVAAFLEEVVGRPALLLGHSLGGVVATWLATYTPHLLQGVLLEDIPNYILPMSRFRQTGFYTYFADLREYLTDYHGQRIFPLGARNLHWPSTSGRRPGVARRSRSERGTGTGYSAPSGGSNHYRPSPNRCAPRPP